MLIYRKKTWENKYCIGYNEFHFWGFIGHKKGFTNKWFLSLIPFSNNKGAWHIMGFRFTKTPSYVSKHQSEINGWYSSDVELLKKLRSL